MQEIVAYCGMVCTECPAFDATQKNDVKSKADIAQKWSKQYKMTLRAEDITCDGCLADDKRQIGYCSICEIRKCGSSRKVLNCGYCVEFPCDKLSTVHSYAPKAREKLKAIRNKNS